jgi:hypothetical protein
MGCLAHERRRALTLSRPCPSPRPDVLIGEAVGRLRAAAKRIAAQRREEVEPEGSAAKSPDGRLCENSVEFSHTAGLGLFSRLEVDQKQKNRRKIFVRAIVRIFSATFHTACDGRPFPRPKLGGSDARHICAVLKAV